jgi:hypothetical protein
MRSPYTCDGEEVEPVKLSQEWERALARLQAMENAYQDSAAHDTEVAILKAELERLKQLINELADALNHRLHNEDIHSPDHAIVKRARQATANAEKKAKRKKK